MRPAHRETIERFGRMGFTTHASLDWKRKKVIGGVRGTSMRAQLLRHIKKELETSQTSDDWEEKEEQSCALKYIEDFNLLPDAFLIDEYTKTAVAIEVEDSHWTSQYKIESYHLLAVFLDVFGWAFDVVAVDARCQIGWSIVWGEAESLENMFGLRRPDLKRFGLELLPMLLSQHNGQAYT